MTSIEVVIADNSEIMRKAIVRLLESAPEIELVAQATNFSEALQLVSKMQPRVVVMDIHMDDEKSVTPSNIKLRLNGSRLVAVSFWNDAETRALADSFGAVELLNKMNLSAELIPAIRRYAGQCLVKGPS